MESHEVLRRSFEQTSPKAVAAELGLSLSLIYKWAERQAEDGSGSRNPLDRLLKVVEVTGDPGIVEWLCQEIGGYFVPNPGGIRSDYQVLPATHSIIQQFSALLNEISKAAADNSITPDEAEEIRGRWDKLKSYTEGFVACCEKGDFEQLRRLPAPDA